MIWIMAYHFHLQQIRRDQAVFAMKFAVMASTWVKLNATTGMIKMETAALQIAKLKMVLSAQVDLRIPQRSAMILMDLFLKYHKLGIIEY